MCLRKTLTTSTCRTGKWSRKRCGALRPQPLTVAFTWGPQVQYAAKCCGGRQLRVFVFSTSRVLHRDGAFADVVLRSRVFVYASAAVATHAVAGHEAPRLWSSIAPLDTTPRFSRNQNSAAVAGAAAANGSRTRKPRTPWRGLFLIQRPVAN